MGEKFGPDQRPQNSEASAHEQAEVLSPLGAAFLQHALDKIANPEVRKRAEPQYRRQIAAMGREELDRFLGLREEKRGVISRLTGSKYFKIGLPLAAGSALGLFVGQGLKEKREAAVTGPEVAELERLDPTMTPERIKRLFEDLPRGFANEVDRFGYSASPDKPPDSYGLGEDWFDLAVTKKSADHPDKVTITFFPPSVKDSRLADSADWFSTLAHETFHANDDQYSSWMGEAERQKLRSWLKERVRADDRYRSEYVESIKVSAEKEPDLAKRLDRETGFRATEYLGVLGPAYLISADPDKEFSLEDLTLIRWFIGLKDPNFDQKAARAKHLEVLREMQQLRESWQQAEAGGDSERGRRYRTEPARDGRRAGLFPAAFVGPPDFGDRERQYRDAGSRVSGRSSRSCSVAPALGHDRGSA